MDSHQPRRPDGEKQTETVRRNQACRLIEQLSLPGPPEQNRPQYQRYEEDKQQALQRFDLLYSQRHNFKPTRGISPGPMANQEGEKPIVEAYTNY